MPTSRTVFIDVLGWLLFPAPVILPEWPTLPTQDSQAVYYPVGGVLDEGDSQSVPSEGNHTNMYARLHPQIKFYGRAVSGSRIIDLVERLPDDQLFQPKLVTVLIGANDLSDDASYPQVQDWLNDLFAYTDRLRAGGAQVLVGTVLPRCVPNTTGTNFKHNLRRVIANTAIRAAVGNRIDGIVDYAADPTIGPDAAACDKALFADGLHPTMGTADFSGGQGIMALIYGKAVDRALAAVEKPSARPKQ